MNYFFYMFCIERSFKKTKRLCLRYLDKKDLDKERDLMDWKILS